VLFLLLLTIASSSWLSLVQPPPGAVGPYLNGVFPSSTPGFSGAWALANYEQAEGIPAPLRVQTFPSTNDLVVLSKNGTVWRISEESETLELILDIRDRTFRLTDAGALSIAFHPSFNLTDSTATNQMYVFYRYKPNPVEWHDSGFNRLARYTWDREQRSFPSDSEEILIQQYDRYPWHDGGGLFFDNDGYLHLGFGDEGLDHMQPASTQRIDGGFFGGSIRIDVDLNPERSHPIKRQPAPLGDLPPGWSGDTYSQGYYIPNDNPWVSDDSSVLEEYFAIGLRSPYSMYYDRDRDVIVQADVGSDVQEEVNIIEKGDNLQWPYMEGIVESEVRGKPNDLIGREKPPLFTYDRSYGSCIIGGGVYRHDRFDALYDHYIFADFTQSKVVALPIYSEPGPLEPKTIINNVLSEAVQLPIEAKVTGVSLLDDGRIMIMIMGEHSDSPGTILELKQSEFVADPPSKLSELGVFADMSSLEVVPGILPYGVNSPLWSDGAVKKRWIALPNDGSHDSPGEQIVFSADRDWTFPEGTVFIKHFELPTDAADSSRTTRLETRFFVVGSGSTAYGLTYRWNEEGTDATLVTNVEARDIDIMDGENYLFTQTWNFPTRSQCMTCHNANAKHVLGVKTHQLNGDLYYPHLGTEMNQLDYMAQAGMFTTSLSGGGRYLKSYAIGDDRGSLDVQVRSYLDANCASCHREGGLPTVFFDLRFTEDLNASSYVGLPNSSHASTEGGSVIVQGDHSTSELWIRDASTDQNRMPPIGRDLVDQAYVDSLAVWIDNLEVDALDHDVLVYPNPTVGWLAIRLSDEWQPPYRFTISTITGHRVYEATATEQVNYIDMSDYSQGTYIVTISSEDRRKSTKLIKS